MPIYNASLLEINSSETKRYAGLGNSDFPQSLIDEACQEARLLIQPRGCWEMYDYDWENGIVMASPNFRIEGNSILKHLRGCVRIIAMVATVGHDVENEINKHFQEGRYSYSVILDAAATAAVEQLADMMERAMDQEFNKLGMARKWRFSPGYGDWPIQQQPELLRISDAGRIGIGLTEAMMLTPRKSITAVAGLYWKDAGCNQDSEGHDCSSCCKYDCLARKKF